LAFIRLSYLHGDTPTVSASLTWDAMGYYMYLPGQFIPTFDYLKITVPAN